MGNPFKPDRLVDKVVATIRRCISGLTQLEGHVTLMPSQAKLIARIRRDLERLLDEIGDDTDPHIVIPTVED